MPSRTCGRAILLAAAIAPGIALAGEEEALPLYVVRALFCEVRQPLTLHTIVAGGQRLPQGQLPRARVQRQPRRQGDTSARQGRRGQPAARAQELQQLVERLRQSAQARKASEAELDQLRALEDAAADLGAQLRTAELGTTAQPDRQLLPVRADQIIVDQNADVLILIRPDEDTLNGLQQAGRTLNEPGVVAQEGKEATVSVQTEGQFPYLQRTGPGQYELASAKVLEGYDMGVTVRDAGETGLVRVAFRLRRSTIRGREKAEGMPDDLGHLGAPIVEAKEIRTELTLKLDDTAVLVLPASEVGWAGRQATGRGDAAGAPAGQPLMAVVLTVTTGDTL